MNKSVLAKAIFLLTCGMTGTSQAEVMVGTDLNSASGTNSEINALYSANKGTKGGGDQSLQFGDQIVGTSTDDVLIGGLGIDVLFGNDGDDILLGGTEDKAGMVRDNLQGQTKQLVGIRLVHLWCILQTTQHYHLSRYSFTLYMYNTTFNGWKKRYL